MVPILLSGGSGTRLWPLSRRQTPKQFLRLFSDYSLFQETLLRLDDGHFPDPLVICNQQHRFLVAEHCREIGVEPSAIILEPVARNTAPALALAAHYLLRQGIDDPMLVLPADHRIEDKIQFHQALVVAEISARRGRLVSFGINPTHAETGYGYIRCGQPLKEGYVIDHFAEKPDLQTAQQYLQTGDYLWNSGMFVVRPSVYLNELRQTDKNTANACADALERATTDLEFLRLDSGIFARSTNHSIDKAVMEHTLNGVVIPMEAGWSDVGSWLALQQLSQQDDRGNVIHGDTLALDCRNSYLSSEGKLLVGIGLDNMVAVETKDSILVSPIGQTEKLVSVVAELDKVQRQELERCPVEYRPWGSYQLLEQGRQFAVRRLSVRPGASLSCHQHQQRTEHWIVLKGVADVRLADSDVRLQENESIALPAGQWHQLANNTLMPLEVLEVQSGCSLSEEDIVRR